MKLELKWGEVVLLSIVVMLSIASNLPDTWLSDYVSRESMLAALALIVTIALFRYLRWMLFLMVTVMAVGANVHEQIADIVNIDPVIMLATLILLVLISVLNHVFKLLPTEKGSNRIDSSQSRQALLEAIKTANISKLKHLLSMGVEVDFLQDGTSPVHIVAEQGNNEMLTILLKYGVNLNVMNRDGLTPLEVATAFGFAATADLLKPKSVAE